MKTRRKRLSNGATLVLLPNRSVRSVVVLAAINAGSRNEGPGEHGAAHFIEHMLFKGTRRRPSAKALSSLIDSKGGNHNAYTDRELTAFYVHMASPHGRLAMDVVHDMLSEPLLRRADVEKERKVIREEIAQYENDPDAVAWDLSSRQCFNGESGLNRPICGTVEDVGFPARTVTGFFASHYVPSRLLIALSGAFDKGLETEAERLFSGLTGTFTGRERVEAVEGHPAGGAFEAGNTDRLHVVIRFPGVRASSSQRPAANLLSMVLGGYSSARLYQTLREKKGLCYGIGAHHHIHPDIGSVYVAMSMDKGNLEAALKAVVREVRSIRRDGVGRDELQAAKDCLRGGTMMLMDKPFALAERAAYRHVVHGTWADPESEMEAHAAVRPAAMGELIEWSMDPARMHVSIVGPEGFRNAAHSILGSIVGGPVVSVPPRA